MRWPTRVDARASEISERRSPGQVTLAMLQSLALGLHRNPLAQAFIRVAARRARFSRGVFFYKRALEEARKARHLREFTCGDSWIADIGANIGFFCVMSAGWLHRGQVLAIEPEPDNFRRLQ